MVLNSGLDLSLDKLAKRVVFLQHLERDYPEYLTCHFCGWMFLWQKYAGSGHRCPGQSQKSKSEKTWLHRWNHATTVPMEAIDLVLRGPRTGLPISELKTRITDRYMDHDMTEARLVNGQILVALHWAREGNLVKEVEHKDLSMTKVCLHRHYDWRFHTAMVLSDMETGEKTYKTAQKCEYCDTDYACHVQSLADGQVRVELKAWQNLGSRGQQTQSSEQYFDFWPRKELSKEVISGRDLQSLFLKG